MRFWVGAMHRPHRRSTRSVWRVSPACRPATCRLVSAGACRSRGCWPRRGRSGCSTSRPPRSTRPASSVSWGSCMPIWLAAASSWPPPTAPLASRVPRSSGWERPHDGAPRDAGPGGDLMKALRALLARDMRIAVRIGGGALMGVLFFLTVVTLMPFAIGPDLALLRRIGPAILWIGALLASLLALDRLFAADHEDGSLDLILMGASPLELTVAVKGLAHWLTTGLPLNLEPAAIGAVALTLLVGTPALTFIGLFGAALAVALRRGGLLLPVLVLPLTVPVLIFGVAAANAAIVGPVPFGTPFTILCALTLMSLVIGPFAAAATLRHGLD